MKGRAELVNEAFRRLVRLAGKLSQSFRNVKRFEDTDDILQRSLARLWETLGKVPPKTVRECFGLAALQTPTIRSFTLR
jgi:hypothetical protein